MEYDPTAQLFNRNGHLHTRTTENLTQNYKNNYRNFYGDQEVVQFRPNQNQESDDSGVCSPPLWKNSSPSPPMSPSEPLLGPNGFRSLSPNWRAQAIARGQRELMEMVKNMPESTYELTLKDIVEHHHHPRLESQVLDHHLRSQPNNLQQRGVIMKVRSQESKKNDEIGTKMRNGSFEIQTKGLFLNIFPFSLKSKKKNRNFGSNSNSSGKVSPKPGGGVKGGGGEKDWWKKKFTGSSDSDSSKTSNNSDSTGDSSGGGSGRSYSSRRKKNGLLTGCWPFLKSRSSKSV